VLANRLSTNPQSLVAPQLRVHWLEGLRVADASAILSITHDYIYAPVSVVAKKATDSMRGETPLEASATTFHRHEATH
jgi:choline dehydrogenase